MHEQIPGLIGALAPVISQYGYGAVALLVLLEDFGVPVPGETTLIAAAFFAGIGQLNIVVVVLVAFAAAVIGDNIGFAIGHFGGHPLVERYGKYVFLTKERVDKAEAFFNKHGGKVVIVARFIEGLRQLNGILAGMSEMRWRKFLPFNAIGAALWVGVWASAGYFGGNHLDTFLRYQKYFSIVIGVLILAFIVHLVIKRYRRKKARHSRPGRESSK
jgi:membrane protein DedA with SNARE-associated domain